jgi:hypothetical protein
MAVQVPLEVGTSTAMSTAAVLEYGRTTAVPLLARGSGLLPTQRRLYLAQAGRYSTTSREVTCTRQKIQKDSRSSRNEYT